MEERAKKKCLWTFCNLFFLRGMDTLSGAMRVKIVCLPSEKGSSLLEKTPSVTD